MSIQTKHLSKSSGSGTSHASDQVLALEAVFTEVQSLFHRMRVVAEQIHHRGESSAGRRGILRELHRLGARTVPQMARARPVSRQHIQVLVNALIDDKSVEYIDNPAHKRSKLVQLTETGSSFVEEMERRERNLLGQLDTGLRLDDLHCAADALRAIRGSFEGEQWNTIVEDTP